MKGFWIFMTVLLVLLILASVGYLYYDNQTLKEMNKKYEETNQILMVENEQLNKQLAVADEQLVKFEKALEQSEYDKQDLLEEIDEYKAQVVWLQQELEQKQNVNEMVVLECSDIQQQLAAANEELKEIKKLTVSEALAQVFHDVEITTADAQVFVPAFLSPFAVAAAVGFIVARLKSNAHSRRDKSIRWK